MPIVLTCAFGVGSACTPRAHVEAERRASPGGGNFPPLAQVVATPSLDALTGQVVSFSGATSVDPDEGPQPLALGWDFGDGATAVGPDVVHTFSAPGVYDVALTASDGLAVGIAAVTVHVVDPPDGVLARSSSPLALRADGEQLFVVNTDSGSVSVVDTTALVKSTERVVCARPRTAALSGDEERIWITCQGDNRLLALDTGTLEVSDELEIGYEPYGVLVDPASDRVFVTNQGADELVVVDASGDVARIPVPDGPRAMALDDLTRKLWITHFVTRGAAADVSVIDVDTLDVAHTSIGLDLSADTGISGGGFPNLLSTVAREPNGRRMWIGGLKSNSGRGEFLTGEPLVPQNRVRGMLAPLDANTLMDLPERRIDTNDADSVAAVAFTPLGHYGFLAHAGAGFVSVYSLPKAELHNPADEAPIAFETRLDVGQVPAGLAVSQDGTRLYVLSELSRAVYGFDIVSPRLPISLGVVTVTSEPLPSPVALGKRLFHRSRAPEHSKENYIACASCHPEGGADGRTWDFTHAGEGLRNTIDLRGRGGMAHGPVHWSANFDEIQDFENDIVFGFGGTGLAADGQPPHPPLGTPNAGRSEALDALAVYVASLSKPRGSPYRTDAEAIARGGLLFESNQTGCANCHTLPRYTDSKLGDGEFLLHDVGTLKPGSGARLGQPLTGLDTPTLVGLWDGAPYLHDGSAATLRDVLKDNNPSDLHGKTSDLSPGELDDLEAFLLSLGEEGDTSGEGGAGGESVDTGGGTADSSDVEVAGGGCACRGAANPARAWYVGWLAWALLLRLRSQRRTTARRLP